MESPQKKFEIKEVGIHELVYLEKNARFMEQVTFNRLVENIRQDGQLSSVPFVVELETGPDAGKYQITSGNHRVKAAEMAGVTSLWVMSVKESEITKDRRLGIQLSHNSITGQDDLEILRGLLESIDDMNEKEYAHIDETVFEELDEFDYDVLTPNHEIVTITFSFFDVDKVSFDRLCEYLGEYTPDELRDLHLMPKSQLKTFNEVVAKIQQKFSVTSYGLAMVKIIQIMNAMLGEDVVMAGEDEKQGQ